MPFERAQAAQLRRRLAEPPTTLLVVTGPRQVGKSHLVRQALVGAAARYIATDAPQSDALVALGGAASDSTEHAQIGAPPTADWLVAQWVQARAAASLLPSGTNYVFAIDEIQKIPRWSEVVKGLWDHDRAMGACMHVVLLGSSPWLMQKGLTESLAGRFELIRLSHWTYPEMQCAFDFTLDEYVYFGGYPGSARYIRDESRWRSYVRGALIHPNIEKDILQMTRVDKPALLKSMFEIGCTWSGQILSFTKLMGQLQDAGNTVTLAHYLDLLSQAGLLTGLPKYAVRAPRQRASSPKFAALNTGLMSALGAHSFAEARNDRTHWGRLVESAVGAHLCNSACDTCKIFYWRESPHEVDFVIANARKLAVIEVKSGVGYGMPKGVGAFLGLYKSARHVIVGDGGVSLGEFLSHPAEYWCE